MSNFRVFLVPVLIAGFIVSPVGGSGNNFGKKSAKSSNDKVKTDRFGDPLPPGAIARLGSSRLRHSGRVVDMDFSPNGDVLASTAVDGWTRLWRTTDGKLLDSIQFVFRSKDISYPIASSIRFLPDGKNLLVCCRRIGCLIWDIDTRKTVFRAANVYCAAASPDGKTVVGANYKQIIFWDVKTGKKTRQWDFESFPISLYWAKNGKALWMQRLVQNGTAAVEKWELKSAKRTTLGRYECSAKKQDWRIGRSYYWTRGFRFPPFCLAPEACFAVGLDKIRNLCRWNLGDGIKQRIVLLETDKQGRSKAARLSADRTLIAIARAGWFGVRALDSGARMRTIRAFDRNAANITSLAVSSDGALVASGDEAGQIRIWKTRAKQEIAVHPGCRRRITSFQFGPRGNRLYCVSEENRLFVWDVARSNLIRKQNPPIGSRTNPVKLRAMAISPISPTVAFPATPYQSRALAYLWKGNRFGVKSITDDEMPHGPLVLMTFGSFGMSLFGDDGQNIQQWDIPTGKVVRDFILTGTMYRIACVAAHPGGVRLFVAGEPTKGQSPVQIVHIDSGKKIAEIPSLLKSVDEMCISPDGAIVALCDYRRGTIELWDCCTRPPKRLYQWTNVDRWKPFKGIGISADSRTLVIIGGEDDISLFDTATGEKLAVRNSDRVNWLNVACSPTENVFATGGDDASIVVWNINQMVQPKVFAKSLSGTALQSLWRDLDSDDAHKAHQSMWRLRSAPASALPFLRKKLASPQEHDATSICRLIVKLNHRLYRIREKAFYELKKIGPAARTWLIRANKLELSIDCRRRIEKLSAVPAPFDISKSNRLVRAAAVLEYCERNACERILRQLDGQK